MQLARISEEALVVKAEVIADPAMSESYIAP